MPDTLAAPVMHELEIKHSRFLAQAVPVQSAAQALAFVQSACIADATHNCWAYRCAETYRSSDAGEPAGTAGRPILAAIDGQGYDQVIVLVSRWFGGIKLGAGGLVRAYGGAAAQCLRLGQRTPLISVQRLHLTCPFSQLGHLHTQLALHQAVKLDEHFNEHGVCLHVECPASHVQMLKTRLADVTAGQVRWLAVSTP